ncbi:PREDICTED: uncharacterized protein LOC106127160 [Papilio xuthus]|uniref:Uncharacterized protein LOC106127160 n=1 Tax=Papilio xuthus TaxID=66420 RepID=A0AAJ6ZWN9_PAPXU|nr:PREDICTED: uncharacterized protein LOC106127160 [Papilio xuthus]
MEGQFQILFDKMKVEMQNQTAELKESITKNVMKHMEEKLTPIIEENKTLRLRVEKLEKEIEYLNRDKRNNNIIVYGVEENERSDLELLEEVKNTFKNDTNIDIDPRDINKIHRIGKKLREGNKPRPILCSFTSNWKKNEIIKNKKKLKNIYVNEDYPKEVLEKRKALQVELIEERNKGKIAYIKYDKLIVKDHNTNKEKRKRETSVSPSTHVSHPNKQQALSSIKTNRTNAFDMMRARSNSFPNSPATKNQ